MNIAIVTSMVPFVFGGAELLAESLQSKLVEHGHNSQILKIPCSYQPIENIIDGMESARLTKLFNTDLMIGLKFPAYLIPHENKKLWLLHQYRQAYDFNNITQELFIDEHLQKINHAIIDADNKCLKPLEGRIYTISQVVSDRLKKYNYIESTPLFPPLINEELYFSGDTGDYIFYPSRITDWKRQTLLVEAMRFTKSSVKLILAGRSDCSRDEENLLYLIEKYDLKSRVTYLNRFISEKEKCELYANSLGVAFIPFDEDYGYVTIEAFSSSKPVITCTDSGCPTHFVLDNQCGYIVQPTAHELAIAMDTLFDNKKVAAEMGHNAKLRYKELNINWEVIIKSLTSNLP